MKYTGMINRAVLTQDGRRGSGSNTDSTADDAIAFCVSQGFIRQPFAHRTYSAREIYRLKLVRVIIGGMKIKDEVNALRNRLSKEERAVSGSPSDLNRPEKSLAMIRDLLQDFPERI
jgi:hypothetical protein